jgi:hypothetical protein
VGGPEIVDVGGASVVTVVVVSSGGGSVVAVVVATGGAVVAGALVPTLRGAVVTTGGWVVPAPPADGMVATVVVLDSTVDDVEVGGAVDVEVAAAVVEVGRAVVGGVWVATCCLGEVSAPVATSKSMAASAMAART